VAHHLVDLVDPGEEFTVAQFQDAASVALAGIEARGNRALLVGAPALPAAVTDSFTMPGRYRRWPPPQVRVRVPEGLAGLFARLARRTPSPRLGSSRATGAASCAPSR